MPQIFNYILIALIGGVASFLVNRSVAVFNDGLRPILPEYLEGRITRKELAATSFALNFGLVIGFGIPISLGTTIIIGHSLLLAADMIGTWMPDSKKGAVLAGIVGAVYSVAIMVGLEMVVKVFSLLPVNFLDSMSLIAKPVAIAMAVFPAVAVGQQHGIKKAVITFGFTMAAYLLVARFGQIPMGGGVVATISPEGISLMAGMLVMIYFAMSSKGPDGEGSNAMLVSLFGERVGRIKKNLPWFCLMGGMLSMASSMGLLAVHALPHQLMVDGKIGEAALATIARAIGFIPLVFSTAIVTGVFALAGTTMVYGIGLLLYGNPLFAFAGGVCCMFLEVMLITVVARFLDRFPGVRDMGEHIRHSLSTVIGTALLIGSAFACNAIAPTLGFYWLIGVLLINRMAKKKMVEVAIGPVATIILGIMVNLLFLVGLFVPA